MRRPLLLLGVAFVPLLAGSAAAGLVAGADPHNLPIGKSVSTSAPARGSTFACTIMSGGGGAFATGSWIHGDGTYDVELKPTVGGRPLVLLSDDDPFTSDWRRNRDEWVERLDADVRVHPGAKHFNAAREPAVLAAIREHRSRNHRGEAGPLENEL
jgi:hypothetical protein